MNLFQKKRTMCRNLTFVSHEQHYKIQNDADIAAKNEILQKQFQLYEYQL